jgi:hypothetical protein
VICVSRVPSAAQHQVVRRRHPISGLLEIGTF